MSKYKLCQVSDFQQWDSFVEESPWGTIFSSSLYLDAVGRKYERFFVCKGQQIIAGVSIITSEDGIRCELDDLVIYNGILFANSQGQKQVKERYKKFEVTEFIIEELDNKFETIEMSLSPDFEDMRPFLWKNYHSSDPMDKFVVDLRYTSYLNMSEFFLKKKNENTIIYNNLDNVRQSDLRKADRNGLRFEESCEIDLFLKYYNRLMLSQNINITQNRLDRIRNLINKLIEIGMAKMFVVKNKEDQVTYLAVFTLYLNKGCYLFGAGNLELMQRYDGTYCIWESMKRLSHYGIYEIDMEGVNSPQRGWFKLSFGGDLRPYYQVHKGVRI